MALCSVFEAPAFVTGFDDFAVMCEAVEKRGVILASPNKLRHTPKARFVVTMIEMRT